MDVLVEKDLTQELDQFFEGLEEHPVFYNPYFKELKNGHWNQRSYNMYRDNFFYRTELTVKGIAHVCSRSAAANDMDTLILFSHILGEETGFGEKSRCHEIFMENALNLYGQQEFGAEPVRVQSAKDSHLIITETHEYREQIQENITQSYPRMLGVVMALETHADIMLTNFREAFRKNRKTMLEDEYLKKVEVYFNSHVDNGVEERHAADARQCVINNCKSTDDLNEIKAGALGAMSAQKKMWDAMYDVHTSLTRH